MPLVDLPLDKLREYEGRTPRPDDFDAYWDRALEEMNALDPRVELIPHALKAGFADCFHLYFSGVGGARVHAKYLRPKGKTEPGPAVLCFHGYSGSSGDWSDYLKWEMTKPSPCLARSTAAVVWMWVGVKPAAPSVAESAIEKQPACAAAMSSSGLVPAAPSPKRERNEYAPS